MHPVNTDRERFRVRCDDLLVPGAADAVLALVDDAAVFAFAICVGSVARGTAVQGSDVDVYAELVRSTDDVDAYRRRLARFGIDFVMPPNGQSLERWVSSGDQMARSWVQEALVLADSSSAFGSLRSNLRWGG
jgi:hypothetical protein